MRIRSSFFSCQESEFTSIWIRSEQLAQFGIMFGMALLPERLLAPAASDSEKRGFVCS